MFQEEIARLTGKLVFQVDNRPLATFEKKLGGVLTMLRELSTLANKKFTVKVSLDSRSLRSQIEKATKTKITLSNVDISNEALAIQGKRIQDYLNKTTINLNNVRVDIGKLVEQKRFVKTLLGQMQLTLPVQLQMSKMEAELRRDLKAISERNPLKISVQLNNNNLAMKLRRAMIEAQKKMGELKIRVADPQVRLKVDKQHLIDEIRAAIAGQEFKIRVGATRGAGDTGHSGSGGRGRNTADRGLSAAMGFARGALPGLGAAFALSQMNEINQRVVAATNSLEAVSKTQEAFLSNKRFVNNLANEQGLNFRDVAPQYSSIYQAAAPKLGTAGVQDMFRGIMKYGTVHGLDKESMKGSMRALSQMFGKDKIQSEEARQQFAERMPNGMQLMASAAQKAGLSNNGSVAEFEQLMKSGKADPTKILPELAKLMEELADANNAYAKSLLTTRVAQGRMNKTFEDSVMIFAEGGFDQGMANFFNTMSESMKMATPLISALGQAFDLIIAPARAFIRVIGHIGEAWDSIADSLGLTKKQLAALATAIGVFMLPFGGFILAIGAAALIIDDLFSYAKGEKSLFGRLLEDIPGAQKAMDDLSQAWDHMKASIDEIGFAFDDLKKKYGGVFDSVEQKNPLVMMLERVESLVSSIAKGLEGISMIMNGDWWNGGKKITEGVTNHVMSDPAVGFGGDMVEGGFNFIKNWIESYRKPDNGFSTATQPSPASQGSGTAAAGNTTSVTIPSITLTVQAPEGISDPRAFAEAIAPHFDTLLSQAAGKIFGAARAQQYEGQ